MCGRVPAPASDARAARLRYPELAMILWMGQRFYGKVDAIGGAFVTTRFTHFQLLPIVPHVSILVAPGGAEGRGLVLPLVARSVLAAYARIWALVATFVGCALYDQVSPWVGAPIAAAGAVSALFAWLRLGRLTREERALRETYAPFVGAPVDVALIARAARGPDAAEAQAWIASITRRAEETMEAEGADLAASYRGLARHTAWLGVAERAHAATTACLGAALTLARLQSASGEAADEARTAASAAHARIWSAIRERRELEEGSALARRAR